MEAIVLINFVVFKDQLIVISGYLYAQCADQVVKVKIFQRFNYIISPNIITMEELLTLKIFKECRKQPSRDVLSR